MLRFTLLIAVTVLMAINTKTATAQHRSLRHDINALNRDVDGLAQVQQLAITKIQRLERQQQTLERSLQRNAHGASLTAQVASLTKQLNDATSFLQKHRQLFEASGESRPYLTPQEFEINRKRQQVSQRIDQATRIVEARTQGRANTRG